MTSLAPDLVMGRPVLGGVRTVLTVAAIIARPARRQQGRPGFPRFPGLLDRRCRRRYLSPSHKDGRRKPFHSVASRCERTRMPPLMVTGGCGFIGSNFIRHLLSTDPAVEVINFDALTYAGNLANLADLTSNKRYTFVRGDVADRDAVRRVVKQGISGIIHFAAESHVDRSIQDSGPFVRTNIVGT